MESEEKIFEVMDHSTFINLPFKKKSFFQRYLQLLEKEAQARAEGFSEGKQEAQIEMARNLKAKGFQLEQIEELTGLKKSDILKINTGD